MMKTNGKKKVLTLVMATGFLLSANLSAQNQNGLFGKASTTEKVSDNSLLGKGDRTQNGMEWSNGGMIAQNPTEQAPLGTGVIILFAAGAGYAIFKSKSGKEVQP